MKVYVLLIEDVELTIATLRPGDDLFLVSFEHHDRGVSKVGTTDRGVWVVSRVHKVTKHDMI